MSNQFGKIQRISIKGYKSIQLLEGLELRDINIIIGQNGAGKSNFIGLFRMLSRIVREELQNYVIKNGGIEKILYFGSKITKEMSVEITTDRNSYSIALQPTPEGNLVFKSENYTYLDSEKFAINFQNQLESQLKRTKKAEKIADHIVWSIENWRVYHFHDTSENAPLRSSSTLNEPEQLAADGGNLPAFLYFLQEKHSEVFTFLLDTIKRIAPFIGSFILKPEALNENLIRLRWRHVGSDEVFDVNDLSDGTLRFIALAALLLQPEPPSTIVLDEPELGLHPAAITYLAALIHNITPEVQVIAATQSPTFANCFGFEDFIVTDRKNDASTFRRLVEEEVKPWLDEFSMGDIWEKNLIGGRP
jgi:predicted ATPase